MDMQVLPWIKDDVAIEIIGKMIAGQMRQVYQLMDESEGRECSHDSQKIMNDSKYQQLIRHIDEFKTEIDQIYAGKVVNELYQKVDEIYAPYLKRQYISKNKMFNETSRANHAAKH